MTPQDSVTTSQILSQLPLATMLLLVVIAGYKGYWIYGPWHRDRLAQEVERRNEAVQAAAKWEMIAMQLLGHAERATQVATQAVTKGVPEVR